jgi:type II secretory pathway pseudopilin PulG
MRPARRDIWAPRGRHEVTWGKLGLGRATALARDQRGFTLAEALVALGVLVVGLVALLGAMGYGTASVETARRSTTALFLAEQRLEEIKAFALSKDPTQGWANLGSASFPAEGYGAIAGYPDYRRVVTVTANPGGSQPNTKQVEVRVFYRQAPGEGSATETSVTLSTLLVRRN